LDVYSIFIITLDLRSVGRAFVPQYHWLIVKVKALSGTGVLNR